MSTRRAILLAAASVALLASAPAGAAPLQISSDPYSGDGAQHATEVEPYAAASGSTIVASFQAGRWNAGGGASNIGWATSTDGGAGWTHGFLPSLTVKSTPAGPWVRAVDPGAAYDAAHGRWLISAIGVEPSGSTVQNGALVVSSSANGQAWNAPVTVATANEPDKDWIACDNWAASPHRGTCYAVWSQEGGGFLLEMSRSSDGGAHWSTPIAPGGTARTGYNAQIAVQPSGRVVIVATTPGGTGTKLAAYQSNDGGASWSALSQFGAITAHAVAGNLRALPKPSLTVGPSGKLTLAWQDCRFRPGCAANDVVVSTSTDGAAWSAPVRVPIDPAAGTVDHFLPAVGADPASGATRVGLVYYTYPFAACGKSGLPGCQLYAVYLSSGDGGASWSSLGALRTTAMSPSWLPSTSRGRMLGDYFPVVWSGGKGVTVVPIANKPTTTPFDEPMTASAFAPPAPAAPSSSVKPLEVGVAKVGQTLSVGVGIWKGKLPFSAFAYQWQRCSGSGTGCTNVGGATASTYALQAGDAGSRFRAQVRATNGLGSATAISSLSPTVSP